MIVQPDFPDHWKTQSLIAATGDPAAPMMVIRLWAHCHYRRASKFKNLSDLALAGICKWQKEPSEIRVILERCGFIQCKGAVLTVHDWEHVNASLIVRWKGGENNKRRLLGKPKLSESLPTSLAGSDRVDREEKIDSKKGGANGSRPSSNNGDSEWLSELCGDKTYSGIDVNREHGKMMNWCRTNQKQPTRRRFVNWLNRAEKPMNGARQTDRRATPKYDRPTHTPSDEEIKNSREIAKRETEKLRQQLMEKQHRAA